MATGTTGTARLRSVVGGTALLPRKQKRSVFRPLLVALAAGSILLALTRNNNEQQRRPSFFRSNAIDDPSPQSRSLLQLKRKIRRKKKRTWKMKRKKKKGHLAGLPDPKTIVSRPPADRERTPGSEGPLPLPAAALMTTWEACRSFLVKRGMRLPDAPTPYERWEERAWGTCTESDRALWIASDCQRTLRAVWTWP